MQIESASFVSQSQVEVCLVVDVERIVVLVETSDSHDLAIINFNSFHVQKLKGLFIYDSSFTSESGKEVRIKQDFVSGLVSHSCSDNFHFNSSSL